MVDVSGAPDSAPWAAWLSAVLGASGAVQAPTLLPTLPISPRDGRGPPERGLAPIPLPPPCRLRLYPIPLPAPSNARAPSQHKITSLSSGATHNTSQSDTRASTPARSPARPMAAARSDPAERNRAATPAAASPDAPACASNFCKRRRAI